MNTDPTPALEVGAIVMGLLGGLALFLYGMEQLTDALKRVAGERMRVLLARMTDNRFKAAFAGAFVTAVIQSSSVTTVLVVGFISAGLMTLAQSVGVIMGANIGTTITAQIIAFKVTQYALVMIAVGVALQFASHRRETLRHYGAILLGLGLIFFGMELMSDATQPLRSYPPFIVLMREMANPLMGIGVAAAFTALVQSSSATTGIVIVLAGQGFITLEAGIALVLGANIGTCVTAMLAAIGKPRPAVQAALVHVLFNVLGVLLWVGLIGVLADAVQAVSPKAAQLQGVARLGAEVPRQIANAHTFFNVINTLVFIGFAGPLARLVERLLPAPPASETPAITPRYLDPVLYEAPSLAIDHVRLELERLGRCVLAMLHQAPHAVMAGTREQLDAIERMDNDVDTLHAAIVHYLGQLTTQSLTRAQTEQLHDYMAVANYLENIGDTIETNMVALGRERLQNGFIVSEATREAIRPLAAKATWAVEEALHAVTAGDVDRARAVTALKPDVRELTREVRGHLAERLVAEEAHRLASFRMESDLIEYFKRVYNFAKRMAKTVAELQVTDDDGRGSS